MTPILDKTQYMCIYRISYLSLLSFAYALYRTHYHLALVPGSVFLTSIHYWKYPTYSYRRYLDMVVVKISLFYQLYTAWNAEYGNAYYTIMTVALAFYPLGVYYYNKKDYWNSTYAHMLLHLLANIGNIVLYAGSV